MLYKGEDHITETFDGLTFRIGPKSFTQTNSEQALQLYRKTRILPTDRHEIVYDLYTGIGTIANFVASSSRKVIGIEYVEEAVRDAAENSRIIK